MTRREKRKLIGELFAQVFKNYAKTNGPFRYLAQGTLYPDVIESGRSSPPPPSSRRTTTSEAFPRTCR